MLTLLVQPSTVNNMEGGGRKDYFHSSADARKRRPIDSDWSMSRVPCLERALCAFVVLASRYRQTHLTITDRVIDNYPVPGSLAVPSLETGTNL